MAQQKAVAFEYGAYPVAAGQYYLADPCYVFDSEEKYERIIDKYLGLREQEPEIENLVILETIQGDGGFADQFGNVYGVDSGLIALIPVSASDCKVLDEETPIKKYRGGITMQEKTLLHSQPDCPSKYTVKMVTFKKATPVFRNDGVMHFGALEIFVG